MEGDLDTFGFALVKEIGGMTLDELQRRMSNREWLMWRAFFKYRAAMDQSTWHQPEA